MGTRQILIGEAFKEGWRLTKENLGYLIGYQIILFILVLIFGNSRPGFWWTVWSLIGWVVIVLARMGLYNSALLITNGIKPTFIQLYDNWRYFLSWIIADILFSLMFAIGLVLLIIPGLYVMARYGFFPFAILDQNLGPIEALKKSAEITEGVRWQVFLLFIACIGINILGFLCFIVGLLFTIPISLLAMASVYRQLAARSPYDV